MSAKLDAKGIWWGFKRMAPLSLFVIAFDLVFGVAAIQHGLNSGETLLMSSLMFAVVTA